MAQWFAMALPSHGARLRHLLRPQLGPLGRILRRAARRRWQNGEDERLHRRRLHRQGPCLHRPKPRETLLLLRALHHPALALGGTGKRLGPLQGQTHHPNRHGRRPGNRRRNPLRPRHGRKPGCERRPHPDKTKRTWSRGEHDRPLFLRQRPQFKPLDRRHEGPQSADRRGRGALRLLPEMAREVARGAHRAPDRRSDRSPPDHREPRRSEACRRQSARWARPLPASSEGSDGVARPPHLFDLGLEYQRADADPPPRQHRPAFRHGRRSWTDHSRQ